MKSIFTTEDVARLRRQKLAKLAQQYFPDEDWSDDELYTSLRAAEDETSRLLGVYFQPTQVFPVAPTGEQIAAVPAGMPWVEDTAYDYSPDLFSGEKWGWISVRHRPIVSVQSIVLAYPAPTPTFYAIPIDWIRLDKKYGTIRLVPASSSFAAPLGAFALQAWGGGTTIPAMLQVTYVSGLSNVKDEWPSLVDVIFKKAAFKLLQDLYLPQSQSISADGLSQSIGISLDKHEEGINTILFGPKGSNGGLKVAIHGIMTGALGTLS